MHLFRPAGRVLLWRAQWDAGGWHLPWGGGRVACDLFGNVVCQGQQLPRPEMCSTLADDDCDGSSTECEPASQWFWTLSANATGCTSSTKMVDMAVDGEGNTLLLSSLIGTVTLGGAVFTGDEKDLLLVKVDTNGQPAWARLLDFEARPLIGSSSQERLTVDATGSVVVVGGVSGTLGMGGGAPLCGAARRCLLF